MRSTACWPAYCYRHKIDCPSTGKYPARHLSNNWHIFTTQDWYRKFNAPGEGITLDLRVGIKIGRKII